MHLPFQKLNKNIVLKRYIDWDNKYFFLFINSSHFSLTGNQFILCKEEIVATYV